MTVTIPTKPLLAAIESASIAVGRSLPVLSCALVECEAGEVRVTCDNLDARITATADGAQTDKPFKFVTGVRLLRAALRGETAEITLIKDRLTIKSGGVTTLGTAPVKEFPSAWKEPKVGAVDVVELMKALRITSHCIDPSSGEPHKATVSWIKETGRMYGTDGRHLSVYPIQLSVSGNVVLPACQVKIISTCFGGSDALEIGLSDGTLYLVSGAVRAWVKLSAMVMPNFEAIVPTDATPIASIRRESLQAVIGSLSEFVDVDAYQKMKITTGEAWEASARNGDNESTITIPDVTPTFGAAGETIAINRSHIARLLRYWTADSVEVLRTDNIIMFKPEDQSGCVGVTMRIREAS